MFASVSERTRVIVGLQMYGTAYLQSLSNMKGRGLESDVGHHTFALRWYRLVAPLAVNMKFVVEWLYPCVSNTFLQITTLVTSLRSIAQLLECGWNHHIDDHSIVRHA